LWTWEAVYKVIDYVVCDSGKGMALSYSWATGTASASSFIWWACQWRCIRVDALVERSLALPPRVFMLLAMKFFLENIYERKTPLMNSLKLQNDIN